MIKSAVMMDAAQSMSPSNTLGWCCDQLPQPLGCITSSNAVPLTASMRVSRLKKMMVTDIAAPMDVKQRIATAMGIQIARLFSRYAR